MGSVYLAGPIGNLSYGECTSWRNYAIKRLGEHNIDGITPMRAKEYLKSEKRIAIDKQYTNPLSTDKGIVSRDRFDVGRCDIVLANFLEAEEKSGGTFGEYCWADAFGKQVITVMEATGNTHDHPFIRELGAYRVESLDEGIDIAIAVLRFN